ncbi:hypothetical protein BDD43_3296 [Mucilaginibacter gracilis]|uniref:Uncharacterized protein n=1 Tax=Mucilaginibacter gracilis TaxID=423350 RepID=A0A495J298_9SPHI|nr:hypothetical protein [Mucilaginibacter gracilis]RKR83095.1 hypothetical protein BDD43_3296 [Mucilaginibacter gracilis]
MDENQIQKVQGKAIEILKSMAGYTVAEVELTLSIVKGLINNNAKIIEAPVE